MRIDHGVEGRRDDDRRIRLLDDRRYVTHFTNVWRALFLPQANNPQIGFLVPGFEAWLRQRVSENTPYDQMVQEILTTSVNMPGRPGAGTCYVRAERPSLHGLRGRPSHETS